MLTVPRHPACSCEQETVIGGSAPADGVSPRHVPPGIAEGVVLIEEVILPFVVDQPVGIVHPVAGGCEVELWPVRLLVDGRAGRGGVCGGPTRVGYGGARWHDGGGVDRQQGHYPDDERASRVASGVEFCCLAGLRRCIWRGSAPCTSGEGTMRRSLGSRLRILGLLCPSSYRIRAVADKKSISTIA